MAQLNRFGNFSHEREYIENWRNSLDCATCATMARSYAAGCCPQLLKKNSLGIEREGSAKTVPGCALGL